MTITFHPDIKIVMVKYKLEQIAEIHCTSILQSGNNWQLFYEGSMVAEFSKKHFKLGKR